MVGFDLDLTLIDTAPGFAATLEALGAELGARFPIADLSAQLGPPLDVLLAPYLPAEAVAAAGDRFRALYPDHAIAVTGLLPGAREALAAVRSQGGRALVVTGKHTPNARLHLDHLGLEVDHLAGSVWGVGKAAVLLEEGAGVYVGDHVHDVEGARAAGIPCVAVATGGSHREALAEAGAAVVLEDLTAFPDWLDEHLLAVRMAWLREDLEALGSVVVAFSGGADSALLLAAAARWLGPDKVAAATGHSPALPAAEREPAAAFARSLGVQVLTPQTRELDRAGYAANEGDRCAFCKSELLDVLAPLAAVHGYAAVATGTNADDVVAGFRPGIAAARDRGAVTPLADARLTKAQVREASRQWGLPTWDKPASACLSSRVAYGVPISADRLSRIESAEAGARRALERAGLAVGDLRVRDLGDAARIEVDRGLVGRCDESLVRAVLDAGFERAEVDPRGFRSGSMNELLPDPERYR